MVIESSKLTESEWERLNKCISTIEELAIKGGFKNPELNIGGTVVSVPSKQTFMNGSNVLLKNVDGSVIHGQCDLNIEAGNEMAVTAKVDIHISGFVFEE